MSSVFVTGGTGLTGANVCQQLIERGDAVKALVRNPDEAAALAAIGVEVVRGDIVDGEDVLRAAAGCEAAIHCAALLGGASQNPADFHAVNVIGTTNVLDASRKHGMRRVVALGPTLLAIAEAAAHEVRAPRSAIEPTNKQPDYQPMSLDEGLGLLIRWLRDPGRL